MRLQVMARALYAKVVSDCWFVVLRLLLLTALLMPMTAHAGDGHNCQRDSGQNMERKKQKC